MRAALTPEGVAAHRDEVELPRRMSSWPADEARRILRYGAPVGSVIERHRRLDRAMMRARRHIAEVERQGRSVASGSVILADRLTGAKGRFTRRWHAPDGGLWGTLIYVNTLLPRGRLLVPLALGVACCEALHDSGLEKARIRWINDVLCEGRKIAGFLVESFVSERLKEEYFLIGFGINVNNREFPHELRDVATSMFEQRGVRTDAALFGCTFLAKLGWNLGLLHFQEAVELEDGLEERCRPHPLIERWRQLSDSPGRRVVFGFDVLTTPQYRARVSDIGEDGGLRLCLEDGTETIEYSGEIRYL